MMQKLVFIFLMICMCNTYIVPDGQPHTFAFQGTQFTIDGSAFKFAACEVHYPRIPVEYWEQRLLMSKALGCNVISAYVFWNYHEQYQGKFDFSSGNKNLGQFLDLAQKLGLWVFIRPGPYVCAEWDAGGHPYWLFKDPSIKLRTTDPKYVNYAQRYIVELNKIIQPRQVTKGGNILMLQIENEYGYAVTDKNWPGLLKELWNQVGIEVPYYQAEPAVMFSPTGIQDTHLQNLAIGINPGVVEDFFTAASMIDSNVPIFSSETWLGWFTHWGDDQWGSLSLANTTDWMNFLTENDHSFSIYMAHGGTSFGFWAGANTDASDGTYQPDVTSYDYDAAINEAGQPGEKFNIIRNIVKPWALWDVIDIPSIPEFIEIEQFTPSFFCGLQQAFGKGRLSQYALTFEQLDQPFGLVQYQTFIDMDIQAGSVLLFDEIHDHAQVYINDEYIGQVNRNDEFSLIEIIKKFKQGRKTLTVLVDAFGRVNFGPFIYDRKGIIGDVKLVVRGQAYHLTQWVHYSAPLDNVAQLKTSGKDKFQGGFFKGQFQVTNPGDIYLEMKAWGKGFVWVNGQNLGRFWQIGPQTRLYLPGPFLKTGTNEIIVLDLIQSQAQPISGAKTLTDSHIKI